jgi:hypothetical protein
MRSHRLVFPVIVLCTLTLVGLAVLRSGLFEERQAPSSIFPPGFSGTYTASDDEPQFQILGYRDDGTPIFTPDEIRFTDRVDGDQTLVRPAVSLAEADRLGHSDSLRTPLALMVYSNRGPSGRGFTDADAAWAVEMARRHEIPKMRAMAIGNITFAIIGEQEFNTQTYSSKTRQRMIDVVAEALLSDDVETQAAAVAAAEWKGWVEEIPDYIDRLQLVVLSGNKNAEYAAYALEHTFGVRVNP